MEEVRPVVRTRPLDTTPEAWARQREAIRRLGPEGRVAAAIEMSEAVREIRIDGLLARHPGWSRADAVRYIVRELLRAEAPGRP